MSIKLSFSITNPLSAPLETMNHFFLGTYRVGNFRVLAEISRPNARDIIDIKAEVLDRKDVSEPGVYANIVLFGFGVHLTVYDVIPA